MIRITTMNGRRFEQMNRTSDFGNFYGTTLSISGNTNVTHGNL